MSTEMVYKSANFTVKFTGDEKELFEKLASFQEVFVRNNICGKCGSDRVFFNTRDVDGNKFFEKVCDDCKHKLQYGQNKKGGTLFPKMDKGWHKWTPNDNDGDGEVFEDKKKSK